MEKIIEPSLLALNKDKALEQLLKIKELHLEFVHYDVMDGKFVPPTNFLNDEYLMQLGKIGLKANVHLMVNNPVEWIDKYKQFNCVDSITVHAETQDIEKAIQILNKIHNNGFKAGIAVKYTTNLDKYKELAKWCDIILLMSVEPGWGGQGFSNEVIKNLKIATQFKTINPNLRIAIDGGIDINYINILNDVDNFVTGSWFFKNIDSMSQYLKSLKSK